MKAKQKKSLQREHNKIERAQQKSGKRPFYLKKCKFFELVTISYFSLL